MKPNKHKIRDYVAKALSDSRFRPRVAKSPRRNAKADRRAWKTKGIY